MTTQAMPAYWVWMGLASLGGEDNEPVAGFDLWKYAAPRILPGLDPSNYECAEYTSFKSAVAELEHLGAIKSQGKGRSRARRLWTRTTEGEIWWLEKGLDIYGPDRDGSRGRTIPRKTWLDRSDVPPALWKKLERDFLNGRIQVAVRDADKKTGGSGR